MNRAACRVVAVVVVLADEEAMDPERTLICKSSSCCAGFCGRAWSWWTVQIAPESMNPTVSTGVLILPYWLLQFELAVFEVERLRIDRSVKRLDFLE